MYYTFNATVGPCENTDYDDVNISVWECSEVEGVLPKRVLALAQHFIRLPLGAGWNPSTVALRVIQDLQTCVIAHAGLPRYCDQEAHDALGVVPLKRPEDTIPNPRT